MKCTYFVTRAPIHFYGSCEGRATPMCPGLWYSESGSRVGCEDCIGTRLYQYTQIGIQGLYQLTLLGPLFADLIREVCPAASGANGMLVGLNTCFSGPRWAELKTGCSASWSHRRRVGAPHLLPWGLSMLSHPGKAVCFPGHRKSVGSLPAFTQHKGKSSCFLGPLQSTQRMRVGRTSWVVHSREGTAGSSCF